MSNAQAIKIVDAMLEENWDNQNTEILQEIRERLLANNDVLILDTTRLNKITVQFKDPIGEDSFIEKGMKADLMRVDRGEHYYYLHFDFEPYFEHNKQYMADVYYPNIHTRELPKKELYNALEAGMYSHKLEVCFGDFETFDEEQHESMAREHMIVI